MVFVLPALLFNIRFDFLAFGRDVFFFSCLCVCRRFVDICLCFPEFFPFLVFCCSSCLMLFFLLDVFLSLPSFLFGFRSFRRFWSRLCFCKSCPGSLAQGRISISRSTRSNKLPRLCPLLVAKVADQVGNPLRPLPMGILLHLVFLAASAKAAPLCRIFQLCSKFLPINSFCFLGLAKLCDFSPERGCLHNGNPRWN